MRPPRPKPKPKPKKAPLGALSQRKDGRHLKNKAGMQLCFAWGRTKESGTAKNLATDRLRRRSLRVA